MKKNLYLPDNDALRLAWLVNFNKKMVDTYAATLGITAPQLLYLLTGLRMFTYMLACVTAVVALRSSNSINSLAFLLPLRDLSVCSSVL